MASSIGIPPVTPGGAVPTNAQVPRESNDRTAWVSTSGTPVVSRTKSTPRPPVASRIASTGSACSGDTRWVAPNSAASWSREARRLTATIVVGAAQPCGHHRAEPHRTGPEHRDGRARSHAQDVEHRSRTGLHPAGQRPGEPQVDVVRDLHDAARVGDREGAERRLAEEVVAHRSAVPVGRGDGTVRRGSSRTSARRSSRSTPSGRSRSAGTARTRGSSAPPCRPPSTPRTALPVSRTIPAPS